MIDQFDDMGKEIEVNVCQMNVLFVEETDAFQLVLFSIIIKTMLLFSAGFTIHIACMSRTPADGLKLLLRPLVTHKYILVDKKVATVHHFVYMLFFCLQNCSNHLLYMHSELPPLSTVGADIAFEHGNVNNFLNLFYNV